MAIAPNWPGYGGSQPLGWRFQIGDLYEWLIDFRDALNIARADIVGLSMGGGTARWTAIHHPKRVRRLVPVASYGAHDRSPCHLLSCLLVKLPLNAVSYALMRRSEGAVRCGLEAIVADPHTVTAERVTEF